MPSPVSWIKYNELVFKYCMQNCHDTLLQKYKKKNQNKITKFINYAKLKVMQVKYVKYEDVLTLKSSNQYLPNLDFSNKNCSFLKAWRFAVHVKLWDSPFPIFLFKCILAKILMHDPKIIPAATSGEENLGI